MYPELYSTHYNFLVFLRQPIRFNSFYFRNKHFRNFYLPCVDKNSNNIYPDIYNGISYNSFRKALLNFIRPIGKKIYYIYNCVEIKQETLRVVTIAVICSTLASLWKFQYFRKPIYNSVKYLWWSFYCENSKPFSIFTEKLHRWYSLWF